MYRKNIDIKTLDEPVQFGKYQCRFFMEVGTEKLYFTNVGRIEEINHLNFDMIRVGKNKKIMIPDLIDSDRETVAICYKCPEGHKIKLIIPELSTYEFHQTETSITLVGRECPELFADLRLIIQTCAPDGSTTTLDALSGHRGVEYLHEWNRLLKDSICASASTRYIIGDRYGFLSKAPIGADSTVFFSASHIKKSMRKSETLADYLSRITNGGLSPRAAIIQGEPDHVMKILTERAEKGIGSRVIFLGYSYADLQQFRKVCEYSPRAIRDECLSVMFLHRGK